jgi:hypothetical protein
VKQALIKFATTSPAVFRGLVVSLVSMLASVGVVVDPAIPDSVIGFIASLAALIAALWIHPAVTPNDKVVAYMPDPVDSPGYVMPGPAVPTAKDADILYVSKHGAGSSGATEELPIVGSR